MLGADAGLQPSESVTFLFTDVQGSTRLWQDAGDGMRDSLEKHDEIVNSAVEAFDGYIFATGGDGFGVAFGTASDAIACAIGIQRSLGGHVWERGPALHVRMGLHSGQAQQRAGNFFGTDVSMAARVMAVAHGDQIVVSSATGALARPDQVKALGEHRLRDIDGVHVLSQVVAEGLVAEFPPVRSETGSTRLPAQRSPLLGRSDDVQAVRRLLASHRLVTLSGPGGVGKTRLAVEVAAREAPSMPHGVRFIELAPATDDDKAVATLARVCEIPVDASASTRDQVLGWLSRRSLLLVMDNCEHIIDVVAELVDDILSEAPDVQVLATSRESLGIEGEATFRVSGLDAGNESSPAVGLFIERAVAIVPDFGTAPHDLAVIEEICQRLDGIPLAIELAAGRVRTLDPVGIRDRLDDRFRLLVGSRKAGRRRQVTLESTIDWSYDLLDEDERRLLRALAVCPASFDVAAAAAVGDVDDVDVLDLLDALVDKSLLMASRDSAGPEFRMLETIREYAASKLRDAGEAAAARDRHAKYWRTWLVGPTDSWRFYTERMLTRGASHERSVQRHAADLLVMLDWLAEQDRLDEAAWPVAALTQALWLPQGRYEEAEAWFDRTADHIGTDPDIRAYYTNNAFGVAAFGIDREGGVERFFRLHTQATAEAHASGAHPWHRLDVNILTVAARAATGRDGRPLADATVDEARALFDTQPDLLTRCFYADTVMIRGAARAMARDLQGALDDYEWVTRTINDAFATRIWTRIGRIACLHLMDRNDEAVEARETLDPAYAGVIGVDFVQALDSVLDAVIGDPDAVRVDAATRLVTTRGLATTHWVNASLSELGILAAIAGDRDRARSLLEHSYGFTFVIGGPMHWEYLARVAHWPDDEFDQRRRAQLRALSTAESKANARELLDNELEQVTKQTH